MPITPVTVFVGPNNSGKSCLLRELNDYLRTGQRKADGKLLASLEFCELSESTATALINLLRQPPNAGESVREGHSILGSRHGRLQIETSRVLRAVQSPAPNHQHYCQWFLAHYVLMLDGQSRIDLVKDQSAGDLQNPPQHSLQTLFKDDRKRHEVRRIVAEALGRFLVIDPTGLGKLRLRLSDREPVCAAEERGIDDQAVQFHANAQLIHEASDGVKAFVGIIIEVMAGDPKIVLIDEPEAFLHPSLAFKLGQEVARLAKTSDKRVFAATHSPQFVMGCVQSGVPVNIIRLTYRNDVATARVLASDDIRALMHNPLLRSIGTLSGVFYEFVVVTEGDTDRAFYQEINERLLASNQGRGIPNCLFLNAQNKQTIRMILEPLRVLGIPSAAVVDIDVLKEGGDVWMQLLKSAGVPEMLRESWAQLRANIKAQMVRTGKDMKKQGGVRVLAGQEREAAECLLSNLKEYGLFVVPGGEVESWLGALGACGHGPVWLVDMFGKMGADPESGAYVRPSSDDVWDFIAEVSQWLVDPLRKGIPD